MQKMAKAKSARDALESGRNTMPSAGDARPLACGKAPKEAVRPHRENDAHHEEDEHEGDLGQEEDAEGLNDADEHRGHIGADEAPEAADHDDDEGLDDDRHIHVEVHGFARKLQRAAEARERRAKEEDAREQSPLIDAERGHHLAILCRGAREKAKARAAKEEPQAAEQEGADRDEEQLIDRKAAREDGDDAGEPRCAWAEKILGSPDRERHILDDQHDAESGKERIELGRAAHAVAG